MVALPPPLTSALLLLVALSRSTVRVVLSVGCAFAAVERRRLIALGGKAAILGRGALLPAKAGTAPVSTQAGSPIAAVTRAKFSAGRTRVGAAGRAGVASAVRVLRMPARVVRVEASSSGVVSLAQAARVEAWEGVKRVGLVVGKGRGGGRRVPLPACTVKAPRVTDVEVPDAPVPSAASAEMAVMPRLTMLVRSAVALAERAAAVRAAAAAAEGVIKPVEMGVGVPGRGASMGTSGARVARPARALALPLLPLLLVEKEAEREVRAEETSAIVPAEPVEVSRAFVSTVGGYKGVISAVPPPTPTAPSSSTAYTSRVRLLFTREALRRAMGQEAVPVAGKSVVGLGKGRRVRGRRGEKAKGERGVPTAQELPPAAKVAGAVSARCASAGASTLLAAAADALLLCTVRKV